MSSVAPSSALIDKYKYGECSLLHNWEPSCTKNSLTLLFDTFTLALKLYGPLFILPAIMNKKPLKHILTKTVPDVVQSSIFLGLFPSSYSAANCFFRRVRGAMYPSSLFLSGFAAGFISIPFEQKRRRSELALYVANQVSESIYKSLANKGYLPRIPNGEVFLFCITTALLFYFYEHEPQNLRKQIRSTLEFLIGPSKSSTKSSSDHKKANNNDSTDDNEDDTDDNFKNKAKINNDNNNNINGVSNGVLHQDILPSFDETKKEILKSLIMTIRAFLVGYGIRSGLQILSVLATKRKLLKTPLKFLLTCFGKTSVDFGLFLLWLVGVYKGSKIFLRQVRKTDDKYNTLVAGALSGIGILFSKSTEMVMYVASKAAEALYNAGISRGYYKAWYYGDIALFSISCAFLFYFTFIEPEVLRPSYDRFLVKFSKGKVDVPRQILRTLLQEKARLVAEQKKL